MRPRQSHVRHVSRGASRTSRSSTPTASSITRWLTVSQQEGGCDDTTVGKLCNRFHYRSGPVRAPNRSTDIKGKRDTKTSVDGVTAGIGLGRGEPCTKEFVFWGVPCGTSAAFTTRREPDNAVVSFSVEVSINTVTKRLGP